jgi:hypothetical protein
MYSDKQNGSEKIMANIHSISTFLETELGEAVDSIIDPSGYGSATFLIKEFMEKHKDELIDFWVKQGKDGKAVFDRLYGKWSMTKAEQEALKAEKEKEGHNKLVNQYVALGESKESSENLASLFPDSNPLDIVRGKAYNIQNKPEGKNIKEIVGLQEKLYDVNAELKRKEETLDRNPHLKENLEPKIAQLREERAVLEARIAELKPQQQQTEPQQQPHP